MMLPTRPPLRTRLSDSLARNPVRSASLATLCASMLAAGVALVVNVLMARALGPSARGQVAWALQFAYVGAPLMTLGIDRLILREGISDSPGRLMRPIWVMALVFALPCLLLPSPIAGFLGVGTACAGAMIAVERASGLYSRRLRRFLMFHFSYQLWVLASSGVLAVLSVQDEHIWLATYAVPALWIAGFEFALSRREAGTADRRRRVRPSRDGLILMCGGLSMLLGARVERLLLPVLSSTRELGLYMGVATASELIVWAARGVGDARVRAFRENSDFSRRLLARIVMKDAFKLAAACVPLGLAILFGLIPLLGPGFEGSRVLVIPLCASAVAWSISLQVSSAWLALGKSKSSFRYDFGVAIAAAASALVLIPPFGALGAAMGCCVAYSLSSGVGLLLLPRGRTSVE